MKIEDFEAYRSQEIDFELCEADVLWAELNCTFTRLRDKFGGYMEELALPSMTEVLHDRFQMDVFMPRVRSRQNDRSLTLGLLAYSKKTVEVFVVEVTSLYPEDGLERIKKNLQEFRHFFPEHAGKCVYGILSVGDVSEDLRQEILDEGIYLARIHDEEFELTVPEGFQPRAF